jgi:hypothetical protein
MSSPASPQKRQANRRNALKSTGPRSRQGKQSSSLNALRHGLSGGADLRLNDPDVSSISALIQLDGVEPHQASELAIKIIDYEKNLAYQRQLLDGSALQSLPEPDIQALLKVSFGREIEMLDDIAEEEFELKGRYNNLRDLKFVAMMKLKMTRMVLRPYRQRQREHAKRVANSVRYLKRSGNQLIKSLKGLRMTRDEAGSA